MTIKEFNNLKKGDKLVSNNGRYYKFLSTNMSNDMISVIYQESSLILGHTEFSFDYFMDNISVTRNYML